MPNDSTNSHRAAILEQIGGRELPKVTGYNVLLAIFKRPQKTKGGILLTEKTRDEDEYQGRVGLVVALGDQAYQGKNFQTDEYDAEAERYKMHPPWVAVGDWAVFPNFENAATKFRFAGEVVMCAIPDDRVIATVTDPMDVF